MCMYAEGTSYHRPMSPPSSELFAVLPIANAGRGVIVKQDIPAGTVVLDSDGPVAHVIFRSYKKEVCAQCFEYDRGRTLPVRDNDTGKVFCSLRCQSKWIEANDVVAVEAWKALYALVQSQSKNLLNSAEAPTGSKPDPTAIETAWEEAVKQSALSDKLHDEDSPLPPQARRTQTRNKVKSRKIDPDVLSFLLSGILYHRQHPDLWQDDVQCLAADDQPYKNEQDLTTHCNSFMQLNADLPLTILSADTADVCRTLAHVGSHNAFGIRSGSEDGEEYMGYSLYPSASYFNHSCSPNIIKRRIGTCWEFWSARDIAAGDECCITYLGGDEKDLTVNERRARLEEVWGFVCMCKRCIEEAS